MSAVLDTLLELAEAERVAPSQHSGCGIDGCGACVSEFLLPRLRKAIEERDTVRAALAAQPRDPKVVEVYRRALWSMVAGQAAKQRKRRRPATPLWSYVGALAGLGSTSASALCIDLGFHPETGAVVRERGWEPAP